MINLSVWPYGFDTCSRSRFGPRLGVGRPDIRDKTDKTLSSRPEVRCRPLKPLEAAALSPLSGEFPLIDLSEFARPLTARLDYPDASREPYVVGVLSSAEGNAPLRRYLLCA
jgi:hypothetical protein